MRGQRQRVWRQHHSWPPHCRRSPMSAPGRRRARYAWRISVLVCSFLSLLLYFGEWQYLFFNHKYHPLTRTQGAHARDLAPTDQRPHTHVFTCIHLRNTPTRTLAHTDLYTTPTPARLYYAHSPAHTSSHSGQATKPRDQADCSQAGRQRRETSAPAQ